MVMKPAKVLMGGTFDPIHCGHLRCAWEIAERLCRPVHLLPSKLPVHRGSPDSSAYHRWSMVQLALVGQQSLIADRTELDRETPSYTVQTLRDLRSKQPNTPLVFALGQDAFEGFTHWKCWQEIMQLTHLLVLSRPEVNPVYPDELKEQVRQREISDPISFESSLGGSIMFIPVTQLAISATQIRDQIKAGYSARFLVPDRVCDYIEQQALYSD